MCLTILVLLSDRIRITPVARQFDYHVKAIGVLMITAASLRGDVVLGTYK